MRTRTRRAALLPRLWGAAGLPQRFAAAELDLLEAGIRAAVEGWWNGARKGFLVLLGPVGSGKSFTAAALAREALLAGEGVLWHQVQELLTFARDFDAAPALLGKLYNFAGLSVLDDFGAARLTDWSADVLSGIVSARWDRATPTIVTSNSDLAAIAAADARSASRLASGVVVTLTGPDRRLRGRGAASQGAVNG